LASSSQTVPASCWAPGSIPRLAWRRRFPGPDVRLALAPYSLTTSMVPPGGPFCQVDVVLRTRYRPGLVYSRRRCYHCCNPLDRGPWAKEGPRHCRVQPKIAREHHVGWGPHLPSCSCLRLIECAWFHVVQVHPLDLHPPPFDSVGYTTMVAGISVSASYFRRTIHYCLTDSSVVPRCGPPRSHFP
jgi:hypothetical protein